MGDQDNGFIMGQGFDCALELDLVFGIYASRRFIQDNDGSIPEYGASNEDALFFIAGKMATAPDAEGIVSLVQRTDEAVAFGDLGYRFHLCVGSAHAARADILTHGAVKKIVVLGHIGDLPIELRQKNFF